MKMADVRDALGSRFSSRNGTKIVDLQDAIGSEGRSRKDGLSLPIIFIGLICLFNACQISSIKGSTEKAVKAYTNAPVLVQLSPDGKPITAQQISEGYLNQLNISMFVEEVIIPLYRYDQKLPAELGGGLDPGVKIPEIEDKISTLQWIVSQAFIAPENRTEWLKEHIKGRPERWAEGQRSSLINPSVTVKESENGSSYKTVTVIATKVITDSNGTLISRGPWAREIEVQANLIVKPLIKPNPLELALSYATRRGLRILSIRPITK
jgi:hypothetical protein